MVTITLPGDGDGVVDISLPRAVGPPGATGQGVPAGGADGQYLAKASAADYDTEWVTGSGGGGGSSPPFPISDITGLQTALDAKAPTASPTFTGTVSGITKTMVGLGSVDNTADSAKPVSTAQQTALDAKQPLDADLTAIAALSTTTFGRSQLTYADAAAAKTALSLAKADVGLANVDNTSDANKPVSTAQQTAIDAAKPIEFITVALSDETTAITTGNAKVTMRMPYAFTLTAVRASLATASSSGIPTVDINENGTTILSTKLTIDANEKTSTTAATPPVISDTSLADDAEITFDIDVAGTGAAGLKVTMIGRRT